MFEFEILMIYLNSQQQHEKEANLLKSNISSWLIKSSLYFTRDFKSYT
jgi:hypothetical protein